MDSSNTTGSNANVRTRRTGFERWSATLGRFAGIDVKVHVTFLLIIAWVAWSQWLANRSLGAVAAGVAFILAIFACVVLHELGHALTARRYGVKTRDIILLPIGGVARLEKIPEQPRQELMVALGGPVVNLFIAAVLALWLQLTASWQPVEELAASGGSFAERLLVVNVFLVVFNLIPAFPMDGGRVLRALLAMRIDYVRATRTAARIGQGLAVVFAFLGLLTNPFLVLIALFVWFGAAQEAGMVETRASLGGVPVHDVMITDYRTVSPSDTLGHAVDLTLAGSQKDFPVLDGERLVGVLTQAALIHALDRYGRHLPVAEVMERDVQAAGLTEMIEPVLQRLQERAGRMIPVLRQGRLAGIVTTDNVGEFLRIQAALGD